MRRLYNRHIAIPGDFTWWCKETKTLISSPTFMDLISDVDRHYKVNNLSGGPTPEALEDYNCRDLQTGFCTEEDGTPVIQESYKMTPQDVLKFTALMAQWAFQGMPRVEPPKAEARAQVCIECPLNRDLPTGCRGCSMKTLRSSIIKITQGRSTRFDNKLHVCKACLCGLQGKIWLPVELLWKHLSLSRRERLAKKDRDDIDCWIRTEHVEAAET